MWEKTNVTNHKKIFQKINKIIKEDKQGCVNLFKAVFLNRGSTELLVFDEQSLNFQGRTQGTERQLILDGKLDV